MKVVIKLMLACFCIVIAGCAGGKTFDRMAIDSYQNEPEDFRGIKWGQNIGELKNMQLVSKDKRGVSTYLRNNDSLTFGEAQLKRVRYLFWQNKFSEVQMSAAPDQLLALKKALNGKYGVHSDECFKKRFFAE